KVVTIEQLMKQLPKPSEVENITITGGEPLVQVHIEYLIELLAKRDYYVIIETNGSLKIPSIVHKIRHRVGWVIDIKLPSSGHYHLSDIQNLPVDLCNNDWIKFVIGSPVDYTEAQQIIKGFGKDFSNFAFSPIVNVVHPEYLISTFLVSNMIENKDKAVLSIQLHKLIGVK
ncbi:hypothetical protein LCGC14_1482670, partial [marine sediment metagenome]